MTRRLRLFRLVIISGILLVLGGPAAAQALSMHASAGLAGYARPERWTPVRVEVISPSRPLNGELVVLWGTARVHRTLSLASGTARQLELYVRTADPRDVITVRFVSDGVTLADVQAAVQVIPYDESSPPLILCGPRVLADETACLAGMATPAMPRSWRGWDAADAVRLSAEEMGAMTAEQRRAFALHEARSRLFHLGLGNPILGDVPTERLWTARSALLLVSYSVATILVLFVVRVRRRGGTVIAMMVCAMLASATVLAIGRVGPGRTIVVHQASSIDQFEGSDSSLVTLRGVAEFPTFTRYTLRPDLDDSVFAAGIGDSQEVSRLDESGFPILRGTFGLGRTTSFSFEGATPTNVLRVLRADGVVRLTNDTNLTLTGCILSSMPSSVPRALAPGETVIADVSTNDADPSFACVLSQLPWGFTDPGYPVAIIGQTAVVVHLKPSDDAETESDR